MRNKFQSFVLKNLPAIFLTLGAIGLLFFALAFLGTASNSQGGRPYPSVSQACQELIPCQAPTNSWLCPVHCWDYPEELPLEGEKPASAASLLKP